MRAAWILGEKREARSLESLRKAIAENRDDPYVLESIVTALGKIGDKCVLGDLAALLRESFLIVRVQAARAIGRIGDPAGVELLMNALQDENEVVRQSAREALQNQGQGEL